MGLRENLSARPRWQKWALGIGVALALYAILGFLVLPPILRTQGEQALRESTGREVRIGKVRVNPFLLSLSVHDFALADGDGSPFVEFAELHLDFETSSIFRRALTFRETRLVAPFVHLKILPDGSFNLAELIVPDETVEEPAPEESEPLAVLIGLAAIQQGRLVFTDTSHPTPFEHEITPLDIELRNFGTRPDDESPYSFTATTGAGEALKWQGSLTVVPLESSGEFELSGVQPRTGWLYVQDNVLFEVTEGRVDVKGRYAIDARDGLRGRLDGGEVRIRDFTVIDRESGEAAVEIPELDLDGIEIAYPEQTIEIETLTSKSARIRIIRLDDGGLRIEQLSQMGSHPGADGDPAPTTPAIASPEEEEEQARADAGEEDDAPPWTWAIGRIELTGNRVDFDDATTEPPVHLALDPLDLRVRDLTSDPRAAIQLAMSLAVESGGRLELEGPVVVEPLSLGLRIAASDLDLRAFEPYWTPTLAVDLASGRIGFDGRLDVRDGDAQKPKIEFAGNVRVDDLRALDQALAADLLGWSALELGGIALAIEPTSLRLEKLRIARPAVHLVIAPDGTSNLSTVVVDSTGEDGSGSDPSAAAAEPTDPIPIEIALLEISEGVIDLQDRSVTPSFSTGVSALGGRIEGLSSDADARARVALSGLLDGATPLAIDGVLSPLARVPYVDLRISFENFELTPFTPYSGRYIGRSIARGKLFVDLEYVLESDELVGENEIFLDQFTLGEDVASDEAMDLPVGLAIALLKNRKGEIRIDLPVRGNVDDPEFGIGRVIGMALRNLITRIALSPFAIVGGLAGADGDAMSQVLFAPGSADLDAGQLAKIDALAQALGDRPALSLEVTGEASSRLDRPALQAAALEAELRLMRFREKQSAWFGDKPASADAVVLTPDDRVRLLEKRYEASAAADDAPLPADDADPAAREAELARRLGEQIVIEATTLRDLAQRRATAIRDHLVSVGGVTAERIFLLDVSLDASPSEEAPRASLALAAD